MDNIIHEKLKVLQEQYKLALPNKITNIESKWQSLLCHWNINELKVLHLDVYNLCGSSGTYGYAELYRAARILEIKLKRLTKSQKKDTSVLNEITYDLDRMKLCIEGSLELASITNIILQNEEENQVIYILEHEHEAAKEMAWGLEHASYEVTCFDKLSQLVEAVHVLKPKVLIIDVTFLEEIAGLSEVKKLYQSIKKDTKLFCIVHNEDLAPRLLAIGAGCSGVFQKPLDLPRMLQTIHKNIHAMHRANYRVLIVDDSKVLSQYFSMILSQAGMETNILNNPTQLFERLTSFQPDLVLMDVYMPFCSGFELAAAMRQDDRFNKIPIVFLSGEDDKQKQLSALSFGAEDFLTKPVIPTHLVSTVDIRIKRAGDLDYYMTSDSLTGLINHQSFMKRLGMEMIHAKQIGIPLTFVMVDIDHFKNINDTYGHPIGDMVLKELATLFVRSVRRRDFIGRCGGEEFGLAIVGATLEQGIQVANRIREQFAALVFKANDVSFSVTLSAGASNMRENSDVASIVAEADQSLYQAKSQGRNQTVAYSIKH